MSKAQGNGERAEWPDDRWCNDEVLLDMNAMTELPPLPRSEKYLAWARAERAQLARWDAAFRAQLESRGIKLTPEELEEPRPPMSAQ